MAVPWLVVGNLVLNNLDKIIGVVRPGFTRKKVEVASAQFELLNQQIAELQTASSTNAEQIKDLAAQVKEVVSALAQAAANAAAERAAVRRLVFAAFAASAIAIALCAWVLVR
jgi:chromosome condensin MukBEF ATPase and DNA-binding subunit MukB